MLSRNSAGQSLVPKRNILSKLTQRGLTILSLLLLTFFLTACVGDGGGRLSVTSRSHDDATLKSGFQSGYYAWDEDASRLTFVLFDGPRETPQQVAVVRVFWLPRAGYTPVERSSTNATIHYLILAGDARLEAGVYSGAGFVFNYDKPGQHALRAGVWDSNLRLGQHTQGFRDRLGLAELRGRFTAVRDDQGVAADLERLDQQAKFLLGAPLLDHSASN